MHELTLVVHRQAVRKEDPGGRKGNADPAAVWCLTAQRSPEYSFKRLPTA